MTGDYWQVDRLRRELITHHQGKRQNLHEMQRSETTLVPKGQLIDEREAQIEHQKSEKKVLHKDSWRTEKKKKKFSDKIKKDYVIPDDVVRSGIDRQAKLFRGNIDDLLHPESASSQKPADVQKKPSSHQREAGKPVSKGPRLKKIEVGLPAAKRHVGKQKRVAE